MDFLHFPPPARKRCVVTGPSVLREDQWRQRWTIHIMAMDRCWERSANRCSFSQRICCFLSAKGSTPLSDLTRDLSTAPLYNNFLPFEDTNFYSELSLKHFEVPISPCFSFLPLQIKSPCIHFKHNLLKTWNLSPYVSTQPRKKKKPNKPTIPQQAACYRSFLHYCKTNQNKITKVTHWRGELHLRLASQVSGEVQGMMMK